MYTKIRYAKETKLSIILMLTIYVLMFLFLYCFQEEEKILHVVSLEVSTKKIKQKRQQKFFNDRIIAFLIKIYNNEYA